MVFVPKGCVSEGSRQRVSIPLVTNPWNPGSNSPEQGRQSPRASAGSRPQHPDSVSETLRISDMVQARKVPPGSGWRKFIYSASLQTIKRGKSPAERHYRELPARIRRHNRKQYVVGVVSGKGG